MDKSLSNFAGKKVDALIVDLRSSQGTNDFAMATEFAKRFCPKGKTLFTLRKPAARQDRVFNSDRDPAFHGMVMVLADGDTAGSAEALAAALRLYDKALVIGQPTAGRAAKTWAAVGESAGTRTGLAARSGCCHLARDLSKAVSGVD